jgi:hypothetical protein
MTNLHKPVRRRIEVRERGRIGPALYTLEISQDGVRMRQYGKVKWLGPVPFGHVWMMCGRASADQIRRDREARARARRAGRA